MDFLYGFLLGILLTAIVMIILSWNNKPEEPKERIFDNWLTVAPGHAVRLRLPLRNEQVKNLVKYVSRGGELTARGLKHCGLSGLDYEKVRKELIGRELVTLGAKGQLVPLPALKRFLAAEYENAKRTEQNRQY